jgi:hypothetical protein
MSGAGQRNAIGAGIEHHTRAVAESYKRSIEEIAQAKEQRESSGVLFGTIVGGPLIGTLVGSAIGATAAEGGSDNEPKRPIAIVSADSSSWRAVRNDPD